MCIELSNVQIFVLGIVVITLGAVASDKIHRRLHRSTIVLFSAVILVLVGIVPPEAVWKQYVDFNTLGLLGGMMIMVTIMRRSGIFQYAAIKAAKSARGEPRLALLLLTLTTALFSAFLDNVTTVLLLVPITLLIADALGTSPLPFLISEAMASNIGGAATLIGDPPNILVGSAAGLSFTDFILKATPIVLVILAGAVGMFVFVFRKLLVADGAYTQRIASFDESKAIQDRPLLIKTLVVFGLTIVGFVLHEMVHLPPSAVALAGAVIMLSVSRVRPDEIIGDIEWSTLLFFIGIFVLVGGLEQSGLITRVATSILTSTQSLTVLSLFVLWTSGLAASILGAVPVATAFIPLVRTIGAQLGLESAGLAPLWWSLALGASLGANGTPIGSAANLVVLGLSERHSRARITFGRYSRLGLPLVVFSLAILSLYIWLRFLVSQ
jgi:Na+/H+ antiporter NhaD/arsenite permease-like protein